jgi:hypothetical protein
MTNEQLLAEVDDILRTMPTFEEFSAHHVDTPAWTGRALAAIHQWDFVHELPANQAAASIHSGVRPTVFQGFLKMQTLLHQVRADLRMKTDQTSVVLQRGQVFDYFDELRRVVETARQDVYFVDAYLDAEFVPRFLPHVASAVTIRLLGGPKKMPTLLPAVELFAKQHGRGVAVRSSSELHDRFVFVDGRECYLSGASFKDGAKNAPVVLTRVADAFLAMWNTYDRLWQEGKVERA